jgi:CBS domain-containing protein/hemerythrin
MKQVDPAHHIDAIDDLSQSTLKVLSSLGDLAELLGSSAPASDINRLFAALLDRIGNHFALEEGLMDRLGYQGRLWHRVVHRELLTELRIAKAGGSANHACVDSPLLKRIHEIFLQESEDDDIFRARAKLGLFKEVLGDVHPADLAQVLSDFDKDERDEIFATLEVAQASGTLEEVPAAMQRELVAGLSIERVAALIDFMTPAQAATVLRNLTPAESWAILQQLGTLPSRKITALVSAPQQTSLLPVATLRYLRCEAATLCGPLLAGYRQMAAQPRLWRYVYIVDGDGVLLGVADIRDALKAEPDASLADIMMTNVICLRDSDSVETAARLFRHYGFSALPVVDSGGIMMGALVDRDIVMVGSW